MAINVDNGNDDRVQITNVNISCKHGCQHNKKPFQILKAFYENCE